MVTLEESNIRLKKIAVFNRYLYAFLLISLFMYTIQIDWHENGVTNILLAICWVTNIAYIFINEITRRIIRRSVKPTPEVCYVIVQVNAVISSFLIAVMTFCTGNTDYLILFTAPILISLFFSQSKLSIILFGIETVLLFAAEYSGWLKSSLLVANKGLFYSTSVTISVAMALLCYLGIIFSNSIKRSNEKANILHNLATTDALTGLINRREFNKRIMEEVARCKRHKSPVSLALFDIDYFKRINDKYGHIAGDLILKEIGELISVNTRECDVAARYGGEEFALILPETTLAEAQEILERLREMIEDQYFYVSNHAIQATISVGVAQFDFMDTGPDDFCDRTDKALYQAKRNGRNRVELATYSLPKLDFEKIFASKEV